MGKDHYRVLDLFCPMHLVLDRQGKIVRCGATLQKINDRQLLGLPFQEVFRLKRPRGVKSVADLAKAGGTLRLKLRGGAQTEMKGVVCRMNGELVLNLTFGIGVIDAIKTYDLTSRDFAETDLTVEMLYLFEAKSAAMEASRSLNQRLQGAKIAAEEQAFTDTLTGLKNRRALDHVMARHVEWATPFAVMHVDLDLFKDVNDSYGHAAGDHVLQVVSRILVEEVRENDTVARTGGDEFVIALPNTVDPHILAAVADRIITRLSEPIDIEGGACQISASIGIAIQDSGKDQSVEAALQAADVALYASKHAGRGRHTFFSSELTMPETRGQKAAG